MASGWAPIPLSFSAVLRDLDADDPLRRQTSLLSCRPFGSLRGRMRLPFGAAMVWQLNGASGEGAAGLASTLPEIDIRGILPALALIKAPARSSMSASPSRPDGRAGGLRPGHPAEASLRGWDERRGRGAAV